jgi:hypothetical protein
MLTNPLGPPGCRLRGRGLQGRGTRVDLVGVRAHGRYGIAAAELSQKALGIALIAHTDEGLLLDRLPAFLADVRAALFLFPCPLGLGLVDLKQPDEGGQLVLQGGSAGIALAEDRALLPSPCQRHLQPAGRREALVDGRARRAGQVIGLGDEGAARAPALGVSAAKSGSR